MLIISDDPLKLNAMTFQLIITIHPVSRSFQLDLDTDFALANLNMIIF